MVIIHALQLCVGRLSLYL